MLPTTRLTCLLLHHRYGAAAGADWGGHRTCRRCGHVQRLLVDAPAPAHDQMNVHL